MAKPLHVYCVNDANEKTGLIDQLTADHGTYALVLFLAETQEIVIGRLGKRRFLAGYYLYVGSAFGPGGLQARLGRHWRGSNKLRWHIDYLRARTQPYAAYWLIAAKKMETYWAAALQQVVEQTEGAHAVEAFGASDSKAGSHCFYFATAPDCETWLPVPLV